MERKFLVQQVLNLMGLKQYEMALFMKVDRSTVSKWVNGVDCFEDGRVFQLKYYVDKNLGVKESNRLFKEVIKDIEGK